MAHIAEFMVDANTSLGLNNYIARELSPHSLQDASIQGTPTATPTEEKEKFVWRMHQPQEPRKYQLFPAKEKLSIASGRKSPDAEAAALQQAMSQNGSVERLALPAVRGKAKEQSLVRRRKVSVPELGPMTTVQEIAMDSPTIPGRPAFHERSISAPGSWRQHMFGDSILSCIAGPAFDESAELKAIMESNTPTTEECQTQEDIPSQFSLARTLAPLVIPASSNPQPRLAKQSSMNRLTTGAAPPDVPPKSARMLAGPPSSNPYTPYTPFSASSLTVSNTSMSSANTPLSAQPISAPEGRSSPKPWSVGPIPNPTSRSRGQSECQQQRVGPTLGHRRGESEASIMDRGRPKKRADGSPMKRKPSLRNPATSDEQKAFETLPQGVRATEASSQIPASEIEALRKQALGQASRFEVLSSKDVEALSRELRGLDERCEYLRKTHRSLRSGRRNLHDRICSYLRSPRVARFSHESILKQEEALSELDCSIDDWVSKLEQAENRRTRVRQKLLEHVAGALILPATRESHSMTDTPPRSPTKSHSPQRLAAPVKVSSPEPLSRRDVESIKIYADSDISALLKDVEEEITRMGEESEAHRVEEEESLMDIGITLTALTYSAR